MSKWIRSSDNGLWASLHRCRYTKKGVLKRPLRLPIAPVDDFGWEVTYGWTDYDTISQGQFTRPVGRQLRTMNLSTVAMDWIAPWAATQLAERSTGPNAPNDLELDAAGNLIAGDYNMIDEDAWGDISDLEPEGIARQLDRLVAQGTPIRLVVQNPDLVKADVNMIVTMRSANLRERAGEPDARYFELAFTEYRIPRVARKNYGKHQLPAQVQINPDGIGLEFRRGGEKLKESQWHRIGTKANPASLRDLSKHFYGTTNKWRAIQKRNRSILAGFSGQDSLKEVYDKRKRKNQPLRLNIPEVDSERKGDDNGN